MVPRERQERDGQFEMVPATSRVTRLFLGIQTQCTQCHDHPFIDDRKQGQFWGVNVFLRQMDRQPAVITAQNAEKIGSGSEEGVKALLEQLIESGYVMLDFGNSRPASGTEHHYSHLWEMKLLKQKTYSQNCLMRCLQFRYVW